MAEAARENADEHLARPGRLDGQLFDRRRRVGLRVDDAARHASVTVSDTVTRVSRRAPKLLVERHERQLEGLDRARVGDDVVAELEHRELVARHRRAG